MNPDKVEVGRLLGVLRTLMGMLAVSNREAERRLGFKHRAVTRLFGGQIEAKLELVLGIARVIGLEHDELFDFAYPERRAAGAQSAAARRVRSLLEVLRPAGIQSAPPVEERPAAASPQAPPVDRDELMRDLRQVVREVLGEMEVGGERAPKPKNGD